MYLTIKLNQQQQNQPNRGQRIANDGEQEALIRSLQALGFNRVAVSQQLTTVTLELQGDIEVSSRIEERTQTAR